MGIIGKARDRASELKGQGMQITGDAMEAGVDKMTETLADINAAIPVVRSAGWVLEEVTVELGLPPKVVSKFKPVEERTDAELDEIMAQNADRKLAIVLLKSLRRARQLSAKVHIAGLTTQGVAVGLGLIPSIEIKLA